ncbi:MAG TPA: hypothetical protein VGL99_27240, partial [Chloroflexota bacterium]
TRSLTKLPLTAQSRSSVTLRWHEHSYLHAAVTKCNAHAITTSHNKLDKLAYKPVTFDRVRQCERTDVHTSAASPLTGLFAGTATASASSTPGV